jgi:DNA primase
MTAIDEIKTRINIVDLVSETVKLRKAGKNYSGFCPFHTNTRTPAFVVFPESGTWRCFGQCNEGGDIFGFVMKKEGWDFHQTLEELALRAGIVLEPLTPEKVALEEEESRLITLLEETATYFHHHLVNNPSGKRALDYLEKRGLETKTVETFSLGYALNSWDALLQHFTSKGYSVEELNQAGLITERSDGSGFYDRFRNRIMFPIRDGRGRMSGFGARILDPEDIPKFINSPQTIVFDKSRLLYGLDLARKMIRSQDQVVIVEGYLDVILLHQAGFTNTVSPMGTALTEEQLQQLKHLTRKIILALDADAAGEKATMRGLEVARQALDRSNEISFDARGLLKQEARLDADVRVTTLPDGLDPDEVVLRDADEWKKILSAARPIVMHVMQTLAADKDLNDPKEKIKIAEQVIPLIEDLPNPIERDAYRQQLSRLLRIDERSLVSFAVSSSRTRERISGRKRSQQMANHISGLSTPAQRTLALESHILQLLFYKPESLHFLNRNLQRAGMERLSQKDLEFSKHQVMLVLIQNALEQDQLDVHQYILEKHPVEIADFIQELSRPAEFENRIAIRINEDLYRSAISLRLIHISEALEQIRFVQAESQDGGEYKVNPEIEDTFIYYIRKRDQYDKALQQPLQND